MTALLCIIVLTACDKKQHALDNLIVFVEETEKKAPKFTNEDWENADKEYNELITEIGKYEYSRDEANQISELKGKYAGIKTKNNVKKIIEDLDKAVQEVKGAIDGFTEGLIGSKKNQEEQE